MSLIKSSSKIGFMTLLSRIAGYARESLTAYFLGAKTLADAFVVAFRLPNLFRTIFAEGAFNSAFIPMAAKLKNPDELREFSGRVYSVLIVALLIFTLFAEVFTPGFVSLLALGFKDTALKFDMTVYLTRITFPYLIFISLVSLQGGILNSLHKFGAAAFAPVIMNLTMILFMLGLAKYTETPAHALCWGVLASGLTQFLWLYFACRRAGFAPKFRRPKITPEIRTLLRRMVPVAIGAGVLQINVLINTQMASFIKEGAASQLYYADRVSQLPLAIIGTAIGTALLPMLSKLLRENNAAEANIIQNKSFEFAWFFTIPAAFALAVIAEPVVKLLYERGKFTGQDTIDVARALIAYSFGIPAFMLIKIFTPGFYSHEDTKTPAKIAVFSIFINLAVSAVLVFYMGFDQTGLAISTSISAWVNSILLWSILHRRGIFLFSRVTIINAVKITVSAVIMAVAVYYGYQSLIAKTGTVLALGVTVALGGGVFFAAAIGLGAVNIKELLGILRRRKI